jgi:GH15 family glucan-1,4-alpha-glucosidase
MAPPVRIDGFAPIRDYAAIGDGRTVALVARDGAIDWLCLPDLDSPPIFGALLDNDRGGRFDLAPAIPFATSRRYVPGTNVLETTFHTDQGVVRVTDALTLPSTRRLAPYRELARRVEGLGGRVPMRWSVEPRWDYGASAATFSHRAGIPVTSSGADALAVLSWNVDESDSQQHGSTGGAFFTEAGTSSLFALSTARQEPLVFPRRDDVEARLDATVRAWSDWAGAVRYHGRWRDAVVRSGLALKLLVFAPTGAIAAAPTTSLPETIGGSRNWDYRFSWPRDAAFTLHALLSLGCDSEARAFFSWLLHASQLTHPLLQVLYRLNGRAKAEEREVALAGYRDSRPVRIGNGAADQLQLDVYGEVLSAAAIFARFAGGLDRDQGRRIAGVANLVCALWRQPDAGIWEVRNEPAHFTQSKMMCAVALDRAVDLAEAGQVPDGDVERWRSAAARIREFVESDCYAAERGTYTRAAGESELDASLLLAVLADYARADSSRLLRTVDAIRTELGCGPLLRRYVGVDGLPGEEGAFVACSFWLVEALARQRRVEEAVALMDELVDLANDVGLFAEEIDPETHDFLGNFPQGLSHLALINAAIAIEEAGS